MPLGRARAPGAWRQLHTPRHALTGTLLQLAGQLLHHPPARLYCRSQALGPWCHTLDICAPDPKRTSDTSIYQVTTTRRRLTATRSPLIITNFRQHQQQGRP